MIPGEIIPGQGSVAISGRTAEKITVKNTGDRPVQVGSHFHFFEVNRALKFDRKKAFGKRLNIPAGTAVRFEPGDSKEVEILEFGGRRKIFGFNGLTEGKNEAVSLGRAKKEGFL